jgi:hypothetical protein
MTIPVEPHFLYSIREQSSFTWKSMICELIDNAFDADADCVRLMWPGGKVFEISDNGVGTDNLLNLLTLGGRCDHQTNNIGKYGVGAKQALIWLWGVSEISSTVMNGDSQSLTVDWESIASGQIQYPSYADIDRQRVSAGLRGTRLKCMSIRTSPKMEMLLPSLANTYTPGLELGRNIFASVATKTPEKLKPRSWPATEEEIVDTIQAAGREVSIRMGIVKKGELNPYNHGFSFERTYRVIKESTLGAKGGLSVSRIAARISLSKEWSLSTNKDDFTEFQDELADAIYERCHSLMQAASEQTISHEDSQFNRELSEIVMKSSKKKREKRNGGSQSGSVQPKLTGRQRRNASQTTNEDGSVDDSGNRHSRNGFDVETYEDDTQTFGYYDPDGNRVRLNTANSWLRDKHRNRVQDALIPVIYGILAEHAIRSDGGKNPLLKDQIEKLFCDQWGKMVEATVEAESKK